VVGSEKCSVALRGYEVSFYEADSRAVRSKGNYFVSQTYEKKIDLWPPAVVERAMAYVPRRRRPS
jgi:hypothetical protein